jgi:hypothetical protein
MTPQPCVSCWSAIVEYLLTSACAFWMSTSKPASSSPSWRYLRSKFSQRGEDPGVAVAAGAAGQHHRGRAREGGHREE